MHLFGPDEEDVGVALGSYFEGDVEELSLVEDLEVDPLMAEPALHVLGLRQHIHMHRILNNRPVIPKLLIVIRKKKGLNQQRRQRQVLIVHRNNRTLLNTLPLPIRIIILLLLYPMNKHNILGRAHLLLLDLLLDVSHILLSAFCSGQLDFDLLPRL